MEEFINKVEIKGFVNSVRVYSVGEGKVARMSVGTQSSHSNRDGEMFIDTAWHNVTAWNGPEIADIDSIAKNQWIHLYGHLRIQRYIDTNQVERAVTEIVADKLEIIA